MLGAPSKTGRLTHGRDQRFEEGGREPREGACWVCARSCLPHPTHACRTCRAGKPDDWTAQKPTPAPEAVAILTAEEKRPVSLRSVIEGTAALGRRKRDSFMTARIKQSCVCGFVSDWPPAFGKHRAYCEVALGGKPKPAQAPRSAPCVEAKHDPEPDPLLPEAPEKGEPASPLFEVERFLVRRDPLERAAIALERQAGVMRKLADAARAFSDLPTSSRAAVLERIS